MGGWEPHRPQISIISRAIVGEDTTTYPPTGLQQSHLKYRLVFTGLDSTPTLCPSWRSKYAEVSPAMPPPTIRKCFSSDFFLAFGPSKNFVGFMKTFARLPGRWSHGSLGTTSSLCFTTEKYKYYLGNMRLSPDLKKFRHYKLLTSKRLILWICNFPTLNW